MRKSGAPGVDANLPDGGDNGARNSQTSEKKNETINYEINKVVSQISEPVGEIKRITAAVMVDGTYKDVEDKDKKASASTSNAPTRRWKRSPRW
ncbi:MAG: hypothetical protein M5R36_13410 [Deltaproteobacteria bacterium]|nr:hypothetical protein [Deltaproteobacteria bacterium]